METRPSYINNQPSGFHLLKQLETPVNWADNYGTRIQSYLRPTVSGDYTFWIAGDDYCELWLSSDENQGNKKMIANVPGSTKPKVWGAYPQQKSGLVHLEAGMVYYLEVLQKEGSGGDCVAVAWQAPGGAQEVIPVANLIRYSTGEKVSSPSIMPATPELTEIKFTSDSATFNWKNNPNDLGYKIKYGTVSGIYTNVIPVDKVTSYTVTGLTANTNYYFTIAAITSNGESNDTREIRVIPTNVYTNPGNNHQYALIDKAMNWDQARAYCENLGGYLATVTTETEQSFLTSILPSGTLASYWLGGRQPIGSTEPGGNWQWATGEAFSYSKWDAKQPDNANGEDAIHILKAGTWNDLLNYDQNPGVLLEWGPIN